MTASAFSAWELDLLDLTTFRAASASALVLSAAQARYLLGFALLAPTSHNTVPQLFELDLERGRIEVALRRDLVLAASDPTGRQALVSVGCAVETFAIAAAAYGLACGWQPDPALDWTTVGPHASAAPTRLGWVELTADAAPTPDDESRRATLVALRERRTIRAEFDGAPLADALRAALVACVEPGSPVSLTLFEGTREKFAWGKLDELALKNGLEDRAFQLELGQWLLPNDDEHSVRGMRGRELGLDDEYTRALRAQLRGEAPMANDQLAFLARGGRAGLCSASAVCVLSCLDDTAASAVLAGRVFQRCAVLAWRHGVACAVHTGASKVPHARAMAQATLMPSRTPPSVIFRLGSPRGDVPRLHASRPSLDDMVRSR